MDGLMEIARLRFGMIAPVIQDTYPDESVMAYCRRVAQTPMHLPDGRIVKYKPKTIGKWVSLYRNGGIDALTPKTRSDLGKTRVLTEEAVDERAADESSLLHRNPDRHMREFLEEIQGHGEPKG